MNKSFKDKWKKLHGELSSKPRHKRQLAALFLSEPAHDKRCILLVGKATSGKWNSDPGFTKLFIDDGASKGAFWRFAADLNEAAARNWKTSSKGPFQHIAWTNICKIGTVKRNPKGEILCEQADLAIETLLYEIETYKPRLIVFVTSDEYEPLLKEVIRKGHSKKPRWKKMKGLNAAWWLPATKKFPAVLWTDHPQGKKKETIATWLKKAGELLSA